MTSDNPQTTEDYILTGLLCAAAAGDRRAFDGIQARLLPAVRRFVRRLVGQPQAEEDILREAFLALYMNLHRMDRPAALLPFLYRVARNTSYDLLRAQGRYDTFSLDDGGDDGTGANWYDHLPSRTPTPDAAVERSLLWAEVNTAMDRLPERQRQALLLYSQEDLTYTQVADAMGLDLATIRVCLFHARKNLMRHLRPDTLRALGIPDPEKTKGNDNE